MKKIITLLCIFLFFIPVHLLAQPISGAPTTPDIILIPLPAASYFGRSLAMGDVNGDGYDDLLIGAPKYDETQSNPMGGHIFVVYGRPVFPDTFRLYLEANTVSILEGSDKIDFGSVVCCADYAGDGYDDIIIGAHLAGTADRPKSGTVFCIDGRSEPLPGWWRMGENQVDRRLLGRDGDDEFGRALDVCDFTGDGLPDLIVGAPHARWPDSVGTLSGCVFLVPGIANPPSTEDMASPFSPVSIICGLHQNDLFGFALTSHDMNEDGYADLLIGAYKANPSVRDEGEAYLLYGRSIPDPVIRLAEQAPKVTFQGGEYQEQLGYALTVGDFNGDQWVDVVLGSRQSDNESIVLAGRLRINFRAENLPAIIDYKRVEPDVDILGEKIGGMLGAVFAVGDLNGDGFDDLVAGAPFSSGTQDTGRVYIFFGYNNMTDHWDLTENSADLSIVGNEAQDYFGSALACGDINADGFDDVAIGAPGASPDGKVYIILGNSTTGTEQYSQEVPLSFSLEQNYPNPFNAQTTIGYQITRESHVILSIYDILSEKVIRLIDKNQSAGEYAITWDGTDGSGRQVTSGVYVFKIEVRSVSDRVVRTRKMILIR